jgi:hypothetical protein
MFNLGLRKKLHNLSVPVRTMLAEKGIFLNNNDKQLWKLKDKHKGEAAVIIGMGPSLKAEDLDLFKDYVTFACNKIYLAYDQTSWRPNYYSVIDSLVIENNYKAIENLDGSILLFPGKKKKILPKNSNSIYFNYHKGIKSGKANKAPQYSSNPIQGMVNGGATVLLPLIQAAYWCGCDPVYVVGIDFSFIVSSSTGEKSSDNEDILEGEGEVNHFHPDYRKKGETWTYPKLDNQIVGFDFARRAYENSGRKLLNASRKTKLESLERVSFEEVFNEKSLPTNKKL